MVDFKFTPDTEKIIFSTIDEKKKNDDFRQLDIYEVTTGLSKDLTTKIPGQLTLVLDGEEYQNNKFDLGGKNSDIIIVQRINNHDLRIFDLQED